VGLRMFSRSCSARIVGDSEVIQLGTHRSCACEFDRRVWKRIAWLLINRQTAQPGTRYVFAG
jgi:hypothetical protein